MSGPKFSRELSHNQHYITTSWKTCVCVCFVCRNLWKDIVRRPSKEQLPETPREKTHRLGQLKKPREESRDLRLEMRSSGFVFETLPFAVLKSHLPAPSQKDVSLFYAMFKIVWRNILGYCVLKSLLKATLGRSSRLGVVGKQYESLEEIRETFGKIR